MARILIIDGHPDPSPQRFCHGLAKVYADIARAAGHSVTSLRIADMDVPFLQSREEWERAPPGNVADWQHAIAAADHLVIVYPLWLGDVPARLKAFFEQVFRPGFAIGTGKRTLSPGLLTNKSCRVIVTMGMPALVYRWFFFAHSLRSLHRNILHFVGIKPVRTTIIGSVEGSAASREKWLERIAGLARRAL